MLSIGSVNVCLCVIVFVCVQLTYSDKCTTHHRRELALDTTCDGKITCEEYAHTCTMINGQPSCACPVRCSENATLPICSTDGKNYRNECELKRQVCFESSQERPLFLGRCEQIKHDFGSCPVVFCTDEYEPYCGSDGKTYGNFCALRAAACKDRVLFVHSGECSTLSTEQEDGYVNDN